MFNIRKFELVLPTKTSILIEFCNVLLKLNYINQIA